MGRNNRETSPKGSGRSYELKPVARPLDGTSPKYSLTPVHLFTPPKATQFPPSPTSLYADQLRHRFLATANDVLDRLSGRKIPSPAAQYHKKRVAQINRQQMAGEENSPNGERTKPAGKR